MFKTKTNKKDINNININNSQCIKCKNNINGIGCKIYNTIPLVYKVNSEKCPKINL